MFKWMKRNNKDEELRKQFKEVLDRKSKALDDIKARLDQFSVPNDRRNGAAPYDGPERRAHA